MEKIEAQGNVPELVNSKAENSIQVSNSSLIISSPNWNLQMQITLGEGPDFNPQESKIVSKLIF